MGISGKLSHYGINTSYIHARDANDPLIYFEKATKVNSNIGVYVYNREYFGGISMVNLFDIFI